MKVFILILFILNSFSSVFACDQVLFNTEGKEIVKNEDILKHYSKNAPLILWIKSEKSVDGLILFKVREVLKGYYAGRYFGTDAFVLNNKIPSQTFYGHKKLESRYKKNIDCTYPMLSVSLGRSYIYFVGIKFDHMLEEVESNSDQIYTLIKSN